MNNIALELIKYTKEDVVGLDRLSNTDLTILHDNYENDMYICRDIIEFNGTSLLPRCTVWSIDEGSYIEEVRVITKDVLNVISQEFKVQLSREDTRFYYVDAMATSIVAEMNSSTTAIKVGYTEDVHVPTIITVAAIHQMLERQRRSALTEYTNLSTVQHLVQELREFVLNFKMGDLKLKYVPTEYKGLYKKYRIISGEIPEYIGLSTITKETYDNINN